MAGHVAKMESRLGEKKDGPFFNGKKVKKFIKLSQKEQTKSTRKQKNFFSTRIVKYLVIVSELTALAVKAVK